MADVLDLLGEGYDDDIFDNKNNDGDEEFWEIDKTLKKLNFL